MCSVRKLSAHRVELALANLSDEAPVVCSYEDIDNSQGFRGFRAHRGVLQLEDDVL